MNQMCPKWKPELSHGRILFYKVLPATNLEALYDRKLRLLSRTD